MKHKRKHQHSTWRKNVQPMKSVGEWSRMLHLWWMKDVVAKHKFKHEKMSQETSAG
jgi:hypothetical protein